MEIGPVSLSPQAEGGLPHFLVIGAAKSGTTALHQYLSEHPQIFMCAKEARYFAYDDGPEARAREKAFGANHFWVKTVEDYRALFAGAGPGQVRGEAAPIYLESAFAAERIRAMVPDARLIACLRNPIDRAYSGYVMQVRAGRELRDPEVALGATSHSVRASFYADQVGRYFERFPRAQIRLYLYDDFQRDNAAVMRDIFGFLGVDPAFTPDLSRKHNVGSFPKSRLINAALDNRFTRDVAGRMMPKWARSLVRRVKERNLGATPKMSPEVRARLTEIFREDIHRLEEIAGLDLSRWTRPPDGAGDAA